MSHAHFDEPVQQYVTNQESSAVSRDERRERTLTDHLCSLEHHLSRLHNHISAMDYHGLRKRICEDILPLVSLLEDTVNRR